MQPPNPPIQTTIDISGHNSHHFAGHDYVERIEHVSTVNVHGSSGYVPCKYCQIAWVTVDAAVCNDCHRTIVRYYAEEANNYRIAVLVVGLFVLIYAHSRLVDPINVMVGWGRLYHSCAIGLLGSAVYLLFSAINNRFKKQKNSIRS